MQPNMRVLTLTSFGEKEEENMRVTLSALNIKATLVVDGVIQNRPIKVTTILFLDDGEPLTLNLSDFDLLQLEAVVGSYGFMDNFTDT